MQCSSPRHRVQGKTTQCTTGSCTKTVSTCDRTVLHGPDTTTCTCQKRTHLTLQSCRNSLRSYSLTLRCGPTSSRTCDRHDGTHCFLNSGTNTVRSYGQTVRLGPSSMRDCLKQDLVRIRSPRSTLISLSQTIRVIRQLPATDRRRVNCTGVCADQKTVRGLLNGCSTTLTSDRQAVSLTPAFASTCLYQNRTCLGLNGRRTTLDSCDCTVRLRPNLTRDCLNEKVIRDRLHRCPGTVRSLDQTVRLGPSLMSTFIRQKDVCLCYGRARLTLTSFTRAIHLRPSAGACCGITVTRCVSKLRGRTLLALGRTLELSPDFISTCCLQNVVCSQLSRRGATARSFARTVRLRTGRTKAIIPKSRRNFYTQNMTRCHVKSFTTTVTSLRRTTRLYRTCRSSVFRRGILSALAAVRDTDRS